MLLLCQCEKRLRASTYLIYFQIVRMAAIPVNMNFHYHEFICNFNNLLSQRHNV